MLTERSIEDIICKYPELIEDGLVIKARQFRVAGKILDLLFEDKLGQKLLVELKAGVINRSCVGQIMEYEGEVVAAEPTARVMLIGTRVPPNLQRSLTHHGIEWRELSPVLLKRFLQEKNDQYFLGLLLDKCLHDDSADRCGEHLRLIRQLETQLAHTQSRLVKMKERLGKILSKRQKVTRNKIAHRKDLLDSDAAVKIIKWVVAEKPDYVTTRDVWVKVIGGSSAHFKVAHARFIAYVLKSQGYITHVRRNKIHSNRVERGFIHENNLKLPAIFSPDADAGRRPEGKD